MDFYNPLVNFKGAVKCENAPTDNAHLTRKQDIPSLSFIKGIAADSAGLLSVTDGDLSIANINITDVHVDSTQTSLANFVANESSTATALQRGDVLILTNATGGTELYMVSGANGSVVGNYTDIKSSFTAAEIGALLTAGDGISINAANAQISANIAAGTGISKTVNSGQITLALNATTSNVAEGSNQYFTQARARSSVQADPASGNLLTYASGSGDMLVSTASVRGVFSAGSGLGFSGGQFSLTADTDGISEGSSNLYYTDARVRAAVSGGTGLSYNSGTGAFAINLVGGTGIQMSGATINFNGDSDVVGEGSSNLYFTQARARASVQADPAAGNLLTYANGSGDILVSTAAVRGAFSAGTALTLSSGQFSFTGTTSNVAEGSNQYFTQARARASIQADPASGNLLTYASGGGDLLVATATVQAAFSAGTGLAYSAGQFSLNATTSNVAEGSNLYHTTARVRSAVQVSSNSDELINYTSGTGEFSLRLQDLRREFSITLSANTAATLNHNLGKRLVHVSAMDSAGNKIQLDVSYTDVNNLTVTSQSGITVTVAISV